MKIRLLTFRLFAEVLAIIALVECAIMLALPVIAPGVSDTAGAVLDTAMLTIAAGPLLLWRMNAAARRSESRSENTSDVISAWSRSARYFFAASVAVLIIGLGLSVFISHRVTERATASAMRDFELLADQVKLKIHERIPVLASGLKGARAMLLLSDEVHADDFHSYVYSRNLQSDSLGASGLNYIQRVSRLNLDRFTAAARADFGSDFQIRTSGLSSELYVTRLVETLDGDRSQLGFDIAQDPIRREAAENAMVSGTGAISSPVVMSLNGEEHSVILYYLPVYRPESHPTTPDARRRDLIGWIESPIVIQHALQGITDSANGLLEVQIIDYTDQSAESLVYHEPARPISHGNSPVPASAAPAFKLFEVVAVGGRMWSLCLASTPEFDAGRNYSAAILSGSCAALVSILLSIVLWGLGSGRIRAQKLALELRTDLESAKDRAEFALRESAALLATLNEFAIVSVADSQGRIVAINDTFCKISGYAREELIGKNHNILNSRIHNREFWLTMWRTVTSGRSWHGEVCNRRKDGSLYWVDSIIAPFYGADEKIEKYVSIRSNITERKSAEAEIRSNEERLRFAMDAMEAGAWELNLVTHIATRSLRHDQIFGYEELLPLWSYEMFLAHIVPEDREHVNQQFRDARATQGDWRFECRINRNDGAQRWIMACGGHRFDTSGKPISMAGVVQDITDRKYAEAMSRDAEEFLRSAIDSLDAHTVVLGTDAGIKTCNRAWREFSLANGGADHDVLEGADYLAVCDRAAAACPEAAKVAAAIRATLAGDDTEPLRVEYPCHSPSEKRWFLCSIRGFSRGSDRFAVVSHLNVTALKAAQAQLQSLAEVQDQMGRIAIVGGWEFDVSTGKVTWTREMFRIFELPETYEPDLDRNLEFYPEESRKSVRAKILNGIQTGAPFDYTLPFTTAKGRQLWVHGMGKVERNPDGTVRVYGALQDVTESHLKELELIAARDAADAANRAKSQFLANMSHEIRTPLTAIMGYAELMREETGCVNSKEARCQNIDTIVTAGQHLLSVINNILDLSKIEADRMVVAKIQTPLLKVLSEVEAILRPKAMEKGLAFSLHADTPLPDLILSEPTHLRQIIMNLAGNAVKFTDSGSVAIRVRAVPADKTPRLQIDVEDTGPGMTPDEVKVIFRPFGQADSGMARRHGGTGLGLTISRRLATLMGGNVTLERTEPARGTMFRVDLPLEAMPGAIMSTGSGPVAPQAPVTPPLAIRLAGRVLLAEDGIDNQKLIAFHLKKAGAAVDIADNGRIALEMLDKAQESGNPYVLLVTDMQMPEMDGYTLARTLRQRGSALAIVALTAHAMAEDRDKCLNTGCDDYATKPIDKAKLLTVCSAWIGRPSSGASSKLAA